MNIMVEDSGQLIIALNCNDLNSLNVTYSELNYDNPEIRVILRQLMMEAAKETGFVFKPGKLMIEAFPAPNMGCVLYFTVLSEKKEHKPRKLKRLSGNLCPYIFEFEDAEDMLSALEQLYYRYSNDCPKNSLYLVGKKYRLLLYVEANNKQAPMLMGEYASKVYKSATELAYTTEYGSPIATDNAVAKIGGQLVGQKKC